MQTDRHNILQSDREEHHEQQNKAQSYDYDGIFRLSADDYIHVINYLILLCQRAGRESQSARSLFPLSALLSPCPKSLLNIFP